MEAVQPILQRFDELERLLAEKAAEAQTPAYTAMLKEHARLGRIVSRWRSIESLRRRLDEAKALLDDPEMKAMAEEEIGPLAEQERAMSRQLEDQLLDSDAPAVPSLIIEIRPGTGGEEASLFAGELMRMYVKFIQRRGWKLDILDVAHTGLGGIKNATLSVEDDEAYNLLRFESGTHRVQRVPQTEASGRVHTSVATVAVLPEFEEEVDVEIRREDLRIDTYSAGGPGGQHVNKTASAVRLTHLPTGLVVACQEERSQLRNRALAMRWLKIKLADRMRAEQKNKIDSLRRNQIGTGDRSEKIRTYNFARSQIQDHRVNFSTHTLDRYLDGEIEPMIEAMLKVERERKRAAKP